MDKVSERREYEDGGGSWRLVEEVEAEWRRKSKDRWSRKRL